MGTTKHLDFDTETEAIAEICKALGHPTRMQIMILLWKKNNRTCGEIVAQIPLAQSTISKHLLELKKADLLTVKNQGKKTIYSIEIDKIKMLKNKLIELKRCRHSPLWLTSPRFRPCIISQWCFTHSRIAITEFI